MAQINATWSVFVKVNSFGGRNAIGSPCEIGSWLCCLVALCMRFSPSAATLLGSSEHAEPRSSIIIFHHCQHIIRFNDESVLPLFPPLLLVLPVLLLLCQTVGIINIQNASGSFTRTSFSAVAALYWKMCAQFEKSCQVTRPASCALDYTEKKSDK